MKTPETLSALAACFVVLSGCAAENEPLPETMLGVWRTDAPSYAGRYLEIRPGFVTFATGRYTMDLRPIEWVQSEPATSPEGGRVYTLGYRTAEGELVDLRLVHRARPTPTLRFAHRNEIWSPEKPPDAQRGRGR